MFALFLCLIYSCSDDSKDTPDPEPQPAITFPTGTDTKPVVSTTGGTSTLTFKATAAWTATVGEGTQPRAISWISVSPTSGSAGDVTLNLSTQPNDTYDERNAAVTIACGGKRETITVTQKQKDALLVSSNKAEVPAEGGDVRLEVQTNVNFGYEIETAAQGWVSPSDASAGTRGLDSKILTLNVKENPGTQPRQAVVTLKGSGSAGTLTETLTILQEGSRPAVVLTEREYTVGSDGEVLKVELKSNTDYTLVMPTAADWITEAETRALSTYTHYIQVAPNDTYDPRTAEIIFRSRTDEAVADTVHISQVQRDALIVAQSEYDVDGTGGALDFKVQTNVELEVSTSADWIKHVEARTRGLVEQTLCFDISPTESSEEGREGTITIKAKGGEPVQTVTVRQSAYVPELVNVEYVTGWTWEEAHHNLPLLYYAHVDRIRTYSNGQSFTDHFVDNGHVGELDLGLYTGCGAISPITVNNGANDAAGEYTFPTGEKITYTDCTASVNDSIWIFYCTIWIDDLSQLFITEQNSDVEYVQGDWDRYVPGKIYSNLPENLNSLSPLLANAQPSEDKARNAAARDFDTSSLQTGWYFQSFGARRYFSMWLEGRENESHRWLGRSELEIRCYDQFLFIDGKMITFLHLPTKEYNLIEEDIAATSNHGVGKRFTHECRAQYLGRNFYDANVFTIYERKHDPDKFYLFGGITSAGFNYEGEWVHVPSTDVPSILNCRHSGGSARTSIHATQQPIVVSNVDWIQASVKKVGISSVYHPSGGITVYEWEISFNVVKNEQENDRSGHLYVKSPDGGTLCDIEIWQTEPIYSFSGTAFSYAEGKDVVLKTEGGTFILKVSNAKNEKLELDVQYPTDLHPWLTLESETQEGNQQVWTFKVDKINDGKEKCDIVLFGTSYSETLRVGIP